MKISIWVVFEVGLLFPPPIWEAHFWIFQKFPLLEKQDCREIELSNLVSGWFNLYFNFFPKVIKKCFLCFFQRDFVLF